MRPLLRSDDIKLTFVTAEGRRIEANASEYPTAMNGKHDILLVNRTELKNYQRKATRCWTLRSAHPWQYPSPLTGILFQVKNEIDEVEGKPLAYIVGTFQHLDTLPNARAN